MTFSVRLSPEAEADLLRLLDFLIECELSQSSADFEQPTRALLAIRAGCSIFQALIRHLAQRVP